MEPFSAASSERDDRHMEDRQIATNPESLDVDARGLIPGGWHRGHRTLKSAR